MNYRTTTLALACALTFSLPAGAAEIVIGSSSPGGSYNLYAGGMASHLNENSENIQATARTTRGSVENARLLDRGTIDFGFANAAVVAQQRAGEAQFEDGQSEKIRGIMRVDIAPSHWVTLEESNIEVPRDVAGKTVSIGAPGSGSANTVMSLLRQLGIMENVNIQHLGFSESATNLRDGNLDAFMGGSAVPMPAVVNLATSLDIKLLSFDEAFLQQYQAENPAVQIATIPAGTYSGVDEDVMTTGTPSTFITRADMPEEVVYDLVKTMMTPKATEFMRSVYNAWDPKPGVELWERIDVPLHPGAERAYREMGMIE